MNIYMRSTQALLHLIAGEWGQARLTAEAVIQHPVAGNPARIGALTVLGLCRVRLGEGAGSELDDVVELANQTGELQRLGPVRSARAEAAWLSGDLEATATEARAALTLARQRRDPWSSGYLALWLHRGGGSVPDDVLAEIGEPYRLEILGEARAAAAFWRERGYPLEEARALASGTDESDLRTALTMFDRLGARPDAARAADRLRALGFRNIPRGPRPQTRATFAMLTAREIEVLGLIAGDATNREIAQQLYLSQRTVEHHVSAILAKLEAPNREAAVARARQAGLVTG